MKRALITLIIIVFCASVVVAQKISVVRVDSLDQRPLVFVNDRMVDALSFLALNKQHFAGFKILTPAEAQKKYGAEAGQFGAVHIKLVKRAPIATFNDIARRFYFIPEQLPDSGRLLYGYFGGLTFQNQKLFIASLDKLAGMTVFSKHYDTNRPLVSLAVREDFGKAKTVVTPFDKDIERVKKIFDTESVKRVEIMNAKPYLEG